MRPARTTKSRSTMRTKTGLFGLLVSVTVALSGCGLGTAGGFVPEGDLAGELASVPSLDGANIKVGSKNFTESILLGKITTIMAKSAGADVQDLTNIPGSASSRQALVSGQIDVTWEYTGTAWISYLGETESISDEQEQYEAVRDRDLAENNLVWLPPAPMNNTYGFAMNPQTTKDLGITKMSELKTLKPEQLTFCLESEFAARDDGFVPAMKTYGVKDVPAQNVKILDIGAIYQATSDDLCNFGEVFTTDGRIKALDLTVLEDDKKYFPRYNVAAVFRAELINEYPQLAELFDPITAELTDEQLLELNARVDVDGEDPVDVAEDWLRSEGFIV